MTTEASYLAQRQAESLEELKEFLAIPSVSALPQHKGDVERAAKWTAHRLRSAGLEHVEIFSTAGHPVVYGDWLHVPDRPTILVYGHFDVQPVDPLELWSSPPFEATIDDDRIRARGVSDMKANLLESILGVEALLQTTDQLPVNVKFLLEGEEEIGSPHLPAFVHAHRELLAADLVVSADSVQWSEEEPRLLLGTRGLASVQVDVHGPNSDLHSGIYGGPVVNPIHALVHILDSMHGPDGRVLVQGFYDDVVVPSEAEREVLARVPFDEVAYREALGVTELGGEEEYTPLERLWIRPTLGVNGIWGGFQGEGVKTVLPAQAHAKISCRLVPNQDPYRIIELIAAHVQENSPPGITVRVTPQPGAGHPYLLPLDHWANQAADIVLTEVYGKSPYHTRMGATVPVYETFLSTLGVYSLPFGFGLEDELMHAPNEFLRLSSFERGQQAWVALLQKLGEQRTYTESR